jgi:hypothetical protein
LKDVNRIVEIVPNRKPQEKHLIGRMSSRWEQQVRKDVTKKGGRTWGEI